MFESLNAKFDVEAVVVEETVKEEPLAPEILSDEEVSRNALRNAIEKGGKALDGISDIAENSESARAYEVVAQMIKTVSDSAKDLLLLQKIKKDIAGVKEKAIAGPRTQNNLFVGTTADLIRQLERDKALEILPPTE